MVEEIGDIAPQVAKETFPHLKKPSKGQVAVAAGVGLAAVAIANRGRIAEKIFGKPNDSLLGEDLGEMFPSRELRFPQGKVVVRDIVPESPREAEDVPLISIVGLGMESSVVGYFHRSLYEHGQHAISLDFVGGGGSFGAVDGKQEMDRQGDLLANFLTNYLDDHSSTKEVDLMGQSLSAITVLAFARNHPELLSRIRNVLLVSPMGLSEKDGTLSVVKRFAKETIRNSKTPKTDENNAINAVVLPTGIRNFIKSPVRSLEELLAIGQANNYPTVEELRSQGVRVGVIQGSDDVLADVNMLMERVGKGYNRTIVEIPPEERDPNSPQTHRYIPSEQPSSPISAIRFPKGGHEVLGPSKFAGTVIRTIDNLNNPITKDDAIEAIQLVRNSIKINSEPSNDSNP